MICSRLALYSASETAPVARTVSSSCRRWTVDCRGGVTATCTTPVLGIVVGIGSEPDALYFPHDDATRCGACRHTRKETQLEHHPHPEGDHCRGVAIGRSRPSRRGVGSGYRPSRRPAPLVPRGSQEYAVRGEWRPGLGLERLPHLVCHQLWTGQHQYGWS